MTDKYNSFLDKIPKASRICVWGTGQASEEVFRVISTQRADIKIKFFVDSFNVGFFHDLEIINYKDLPKKEKEFDLIILASYLLQKSMIRLLNGVSKKPYIGIDWHCENKEVSKYKPEYEKVIELLNDEQDKYIYSSAINAIELGDFSFFEQYVKRNFTDKNKNIYSNEYMDFINKDIIKTVIDGGACNGRNSAQFRHEFSAVEKIYVFEPLKEHLNMSLINDKEVFEIVEKGIWDKKETLVFKKDKSSSKIINENEVYPDNELFTKIETISLDEFVKEKNIKNIDFIKFDIEGSELNGLKGAKDIIISSRPQMAICLYHSIKDYYTIPLYLDEILTDYVYKIGHYSATNFDTVLYAIPKEVYNH